MQLNTENLNIGEIELIQWQYKGDQGAFKTALWNAIQNGDNGNLNRLALGFPDQVEAYRRFGHDENYWLDVLTRAGLVKPPPTAEPPATDKETH